MAEVSEAVRQRLVDLGDEGRQWLARLDDTISRLEQRWDCTIAEPVAGASTAYVARASDSAGREAVAKIAIPGGGRGYAGFERELEALTLGANDAYVGVLASDVEHRGLLLERLGPPLADCGFTVPRQIDVLAPTIQAGWFRPTNPDGLVSGKEQAEWLLEFVGSHVHILTTQLRSETIATALEFARRRAAAFDPERAVFIHGDAHEGNVLFGGDAKFKMIDPEGLWSEPAHDLAIPLRGWTSEVVAAGDDSGDRATQWCHQFAELAQLDPRAIWEWSFLERVSTGLALTLLSLNEGRDYLASADLLFHVEI